MTLLLLYFVVLVVAAVVTALKGKWGVFALGVVFGLGWVFGAIRLAKPNSWWARRFYAEEKRERAARELPRRLLLARVAGGASLALLALAFAALKLYLIPTAAMEPTLQCARPGPGCTADSSDRVVSVRLFGREPERGDIVVFDTPARAEQHCPPGGTFVKRVIALSGETWEQRDGDVYVNGRPLDESSYVPSERRDFQSYSRRRIPRGQYFVMGDNRTQSCDSRVWGAVPSENLIAIVVARYWPPERIGPL